MAAAQLSGHLIASHEHTTMAQQQQIPFQPQQTSVSLPSYQAPQSQFFGGQHGSGFREMSRDSAAKIELLQYTLQKQLGPEWVATRPGPGGVSKLSYLEGTKALTLANEIFGFNGWSSQIMSLVIDFCDMHGEQRSDRWNVSATAIVRVTLRDGTFHEDVGNGHAENTKGKAAALEKVKKEAVTDAVKRALKNFGNVLGNCLYDKDYLKAVHKIPNKHVKFNEDNLYRHRDFDPNFAANSAPDFTTSRPHPDNAATRYPNLAATAAQPIAGPSSRPMNAPPLHRTAMANAMHADSLAAGASITRPDTTMLWQSVGGQDDDAMYAAAMDMDDVEVGDVLESFPLGDCVMLEEEDMGMHQEVRRAGPGNDVAPPPAPTKMTAEQRARGQAERRAALHSISPTKMAVPDQTDGTAQRGGRGDDMDMPRGEVPRPAQSVAGFRFPDGNASGNNRQKAVIPNNNAQAASLRAQMIGAALNESKPPALRDTSENFGNGAVRVITSPLHEMDKIAANANAALRAKGWTGVDDSAVGFVSARGFKRASPASGGDGFASAVDCGGHPSDLGLRKVLGELNAAELPYEPGSKRPRS